MAIFIAIAVPVWLVYEDSRYFFDDWTCETILKMDHTEIIGDEHLAFHVIYQDCVEIEQFAP